MSSFSKEIVPKSPLARRKLEPLSSKSRCQEGGGDTNHNNTYSASSCSNGFKLLGGFEFRRPPDDELIDSDDNFDEEF